MLSNQPMENGSRTLKLFCATLLTVAVVACVSWTVEADEPREAPGTHGTDVDPDARIARLPRAGEQGPKPFAQPRRVPWDDISPNHSGFFAIDIDKLVQDPRIGLVLSPIVESQIGWAWDQIATEEAAANRTELGLSLANLSAAVGTVQFALNKVESVDGSDHNSTVTFGSNGGKVWFKTPMSHDDLRGALDVNRIADIFERGGTTLEDLGGLTYVEFVNTFLEGTFIPDAESHDLTLKPKQENKSDADQFARLQRGWNAVDGGLVTICYTLPETLGFLENEEDRLSDQLLQIAACMSIGVDFLPNQPAHLRIAFAPREGVTHEELKSAVERLGTWIGEAVESELEDGDDESRAMAERVQRITESHDTLAGSSDATECVVIHFRVPLADFTLLTLF